MYDVPVAATRAIAKFLAEDDYLSSDNPLPACNSTGPDPLVQDREPMEADFTAEELRLVQRFVQLVGGVERARELVDKAGECEECLGMVSDDDQIEQIGQIMPSQCSHPTPTLFSDRYTTNAIANNM